MGEVGPSVVPALCKLTEAHEDRETREGACLGIQLLAARGEEIGAARDTLVRLVAEDISFVVRSRAIAAIVYSAEFEDE